MWLIAAARGVRSPAGLRGRWPAPAGTRGPAGDRTRSMVLTRTSGASDPSTQSGGQRWRGLAGDGEAEDGDLTVAGGGRAGAGGRE